MIKITKMTPVDVMKLGPGGRKLHREAEMKMVKAVKSVKQRFPEFIYPLDKMELVSVEEEVNVSTDGYRLVYNVKQVKELAGYVWGYTIEDRIIHILLHGLLGHFELDERYRKDKLLAWSFMDMAVDFLGGELYGQTSYISYFERINDITGQVKKELSLKGLKVGGSRIAFPHRVYMEALENEKTKRRIKYNGSKFELDNHYVWNLPEEKEKKSNASGGKGAGKEIGAMEINAKKIRALWEGARAFAGIDKDKLLVKCLRGKRQGDTFGDGDCMVKEAEGKGLDYSDMLEEFMSISEKPDEDQDAIDIMLYQYGLDVYGDMPLVEPREEGDARSLRTLIIAIDTSGSCAGALLECFLRDTRKLLSNCEGRFKFDEIIVLECDARIQHETRITRPEDMNKISPKMRLQGFGGTDFRPVFERADELEKKGSRVSAIIYFSDSYGIFPQKPRENTYFVINEVNFERGSYRPFNESIPKWVKTVKLPTGTDNDL
ncbi:MAG: hypothetical protein IKO61_03905 [Lachnospiraceae bacterium]|nr:hypothetical protein [Lachnospiraceae bacterium]